MKLYSLRDVMAAEFAAPWVSPNDEVAVRAVKQGLPEDHLARKYKDDFVLYCVGEWNQDTGEIAPELRMLSAVSKILEVSNGKSAE